MQEGLPGKVIYLNQIKSSLTYQKLITLILIYLGDKMVKDPDPPNAEENIGKEIEFIEEIRNIIEG